MTNSNFFDQVRRNELEVAEGREIPSLNVPEAEGTEEEEAANPQANQSVPTPSVEQPAEGDEPTPEGQGQIDAEVNQTETRPLPEGQKEPERPNIVTSQQQDNPPGRPLNISQGEIIDLPKPEDQLLSGQEIQEQLIPENQITTEQFQRSVAGAVPDPDKPTYAPERIFSQDFNTEKAKEVLDFHNTELPLSEFSLESLNSASIDSPIINALANEGAKGLGISVGDSRNTGLFPTPGAAKLNFGQIFDGDEEEESDFETSTGLEDLRGNALGEQPQTAQSDQRFEVVGTAPENESLRQSFGESVPFFPPEDFTQAKEFSIADQGFTAKEQKQRKSDFFGRFTPGNIGRALSDGIQNMFQGEEGNPLSRFGSAFSKEFGDVDTRPGGGAVEPEESNTFFEPGLLSSFAQATFDAFTSEDVGLGDIGKRTLEIGEQDQQENLEHKQELAEKGINTSGQQFDSLFGATLEITGDLVETFGVGSVFDGGAFNTSPSGITDRFKEEFQTNTRTRALLSQLGQEVDEDGEADFAPVDGKFGEFGKGTLGAITYLGSLPQNLVMAGVNKLWDSTLGEPVADEQPMEMALRGQDFTMMGVPTDSKSNVLTPLAKDEENREWWQWAAAFGGDMVLGGGIDALLQGAVRTSRAVQFTEEMASKFPNKSAQFVQDTEFKQPRLPKSDNVDNGLSVEDQIKQDSHLNSNVDPKAPENNNPTKFEQPNRVNPSDQSVKEPESHTPKPVTKETTVKPTEVTDVNGNTVTRQTAVVESVGIQPRTRVKYYGNPKKANVQPEEAVVIGRGKGEFRFPEDTKVSNTARRLERSSSQKRVEAEDTPADLNPANETTFRLPERGDDPRRLLPPARAADKIQTQSEPLPNFENTRVELSNDDLGRIAKTFGIVRRGRSEPLRDSELTVFKEQFGELMADVNRPVNTEAFQNDQPVLAKTLPSRTTGEDGTFIRKLPPSQDVPETAEEFELRGEIQRGLELRTEQADAERPSLRVNPVEQAEIRQSEFFKNQFRKKISNIRRNELELSQAKTPQEASKAINKYTGNVKEFGEVQAKAPSRAVGEFEKEEFAPDDINRGSDENFTAKVEAERQADRKSADARIQQEQADASHKLREGRAKALEKFPRGLERESIEEEIKQINYNVSSGQVVEPVPTETQRALSKKLSFEASKLNQETMYHGTQVDLAELSQTDNLFAGVDPDVGGSSTEIGVGVHLTNDPTIAENHAQALPPLNRPQLDDTRTLENGAVHKVGTNIKRPIRADVKTQGLPVTEDVDFGEQIRQVFKKVGEAHAPSNQFAKTFKRAIRKNRSIQQYYDQFRRQLAENDEMMEQRVRAFQRDVTRNLRLLGIDALWDTRGEETVVNVLNPERIQQISSNVDLPDATIASRKQARKFVDEQSDIGLQSTKANKVQSELALSDELKQQHVEETNKSGIEAGRRQADANEVREELREETEAAKTKEIEDAADEIEPEAEELAKDWNPEEIVQEIEKNQKQEAFFEAEESAFVDDDDFPGFDFTGATRPKGEEQISDSFVRWNELLPQWHDAQLEKGGLEPKDLLRNEAVVDVDEEGILIDAQLFEAENIMKTLEEQGIVEEVEEDLFALTDMENMNVDLIKQRLKGCSL